MSSYISEAIQRALREAIPPEALSSIVDRLERTYQTDLMRVIRRLYAPAAFSKIHVTSDPAEGAEIIKKITYQAIGAAQKSKLVFAPETQFVIPTLPRPRVRSVSDPVEISRFLAQISTDPEISGMFAGLMRYTRASGRYLAAPESAYTSISEALRSGPEWFYDLVRSQQERNRLNLVFHSLQDNIEEGWARLLFRKRYEALTDAEKEIIARAVPRTKGNVIPAPGSIVPPGQFYKQIRGIIGRSVRGEYTQEELLNLLDFIERAHRHFAEVWGKNVEEIRAPWWKETQESVLQAVDRIRKELQSGELSPKSASQLGRLAKYAIQRGVGAYEYATEVVPSRKGRYEVPVMGILPERVSDVEARYPSEIIHWMFERKKGGPARIKIPREIAQQIGLEVKRGTVLPADYLRRLVTLLNSSLLLGAKEPQPLFTVAEWILSEEGAKSRFGSTIIRAFQEATGRPAQSIDDVISVFIGLANNYSKITGLPAPVVGQSIYWQLLNAPIHEAIYDVSMGTKSRRALEDLLRKVGLSLGLTGAFLAAFAAFSNLMPQAEASPGPMFRAVARDTTTEFFITLFREYAGRIANALKNANLRDAAENLWALIASSKSARMEFVVERLLAQDKDVVAKRAGTLFREALSRLRLMEYGQRSLEYLGHRATERRVEEFLQQNNLKISLRDAMEEIFDAIEGAPLRTPQLEPAVRMVRESFDVLHRHANEAFGGEIGYIPNYVPHVLDMRKVRELAQHFRDKGTLPEWFEEWERRAVELRKQHLLQIGRDPDALRQELQTSIGKVATDAFTALYRSEWIQYVTESIFKDPDVYRTILGVSDENAALEIARKRFLNPSIPDSLIQHVRQVYNAVGSVPEWFMGWLERVTTSDELQSIISRITAGDERVWGELKNYGVEALLQLFRQNDLIRGKIANLWGVTPNEVASRVNYLLRHGTITEKITEKIARTEMEELKRLLFAIPRNRFLRPEDLLVYGERLVGLGAAEVQSVSRLAGVFWTSPFLRYPRLYLLPKELRLNALDSLRLYVRRWSKDVAATQAFGGPERQFLRELQTFLNYAMDNSRYASEIEELANLFAITLKDYWGSRGLFENIFHDWIRPVSTIAFMPFSWLSNFFQVFNDVALHRFQGVLKYLDEIAEKGTINRWKDIASLAGSLSGWMKAIEMETASRSLGDRADAFASALFGRVEELILRPLSAAGAHSILEVLLPRVANGDQVAAQELIKYLRDVGFGKAGYESADDLLERLVQLYRSQKGLPQNVESYVQRFLNEANAWNLVQDPYLRVIGKAIDFTMFNYSPLDFPAWSSTLLGRLWIMFRRFSYSQARNLFTYALHELESGNVWPVVAMAGGAYVSKEIRDWVMDVANMVLSPNTYVPEERSPFRRPFVVFGVPLQKEFGDLVYQIIESGQMGMVSDLFRLLFRPDLSYLSRLYFILGVVPAETYRMLQDAIVSIGNLVSPQTAVARLEPADVRFLSSARELIRRLAYFGIGYSFGGNPLALAALPFVVEPMMQHVPFVTHEAESRRMRQAAIAAYIEGRMGDFKEINEELWRKYRDQVSVSYAERRKRELEMIAEGNIPPWRVPRGLRMYVRP